MPRCLCDRFYRRPLSDMRLRGECAMGMVLLGTVIGLVGAVMALMLGHPFWLALLILSCSGSGSVLILAGTTVLREPRQSFR